MAREPLALRAWEDRPLQPPLTRLHECDREYQSGKAWSMAVKLLYQKKC